MAKRRTRKQKEKAKHDFSISWAPDLGRTQPKVRTSTSEAVVKRQFSKSASEVKTARHGSEKAKATVKLGNIESIKKDIFKSLILAGLILASEIVLYLLLHIS